MDIELQGADSTVKPPPPPPPPPCRCSVPPPQTLFLRPPPRPRRAPAPRPPRVWTFVDLSGWLIQNTGQGRWGTCSEINNKIGLCRQCCCSSLLPVTSTTVRNRRKGRLDDSEILISYEPLLLQRQCSPLFIGTAYWHHIQVKVGKG